MHRLRPGHRGIDATKSPVRHPFRARTHRLGSREAENAPPFKSIKMSEENMKKVIIVGAGAQGNVISGILAKAPEVGKIMLVDLDLERAQEVARALNSDKIEVKKADASNKGE